LAFAEAFDEKNPRLKPADPADKPAWEVADSPVTAPKPIPAPASNPKPAPAPAQPKATPVPAPSGGPVVAANDPGNPYINIDNGAANQGWELLHDGVVEKPAASTPPTGGPIIPPPPLGEDKVAKKGVFGLRLPTLPSLPPVDEPIDLYFSSPFGGIPGPNQGS